jgi:hypothetical protein
MQQPPLEDARPAPAPAPGAGRRARAGVLRRAALRRLVTGLLLAWYAAVLARQATASLAGWLDRRDFRSPPSYWQFGTPQTDWLARCLAAADAAAEPGSRIVLLARKEDFFRGRWAAYLLPAHDVLTDRGPGAPDADLVVALNGATFPGARAVGGSPRCRLLRPGGRGAGPPLEDRAEGR